MDALTSQGPLGASGRRTVCERYPGSMGRHNRHVSSGPQPSAPGHEGLGTIIRGAGDDVNSLGDAVFRDVSQ